MNLTWRTKRKIKVAICFAAIDSKNVRSKWRTVNVACAREVQSDIFCLFLTSRSNNQSYSRV